VPVLVTPLTRRSFQAKVLENDLRRGPTSSAPPPPRSKAPLLDLNADSYAAVQAMGEDEADTLAMAPRPDKTAEAALAAGKVEVAGAAKSAFRPHPRRRQGRGLLLAHGRWTR
jgi:hypothetical protein